MAAAVLAAHGCAGESQAEKPRGQEGQKPTFKFAFDHNRAFRDIEKQCSFGPRNPGSSGHARCLEWIKSEVARTSDTSISQSFSGRIGRQTHQFTNVIAVYAGQDQTRSILLGAHWDTRPRADQDTDPSGGARPVPGANDGASGVAALLELGRLFSTRKPPLTVIMVFFDAEDAGNLGAEFCLGSTYFASRYRQTLKELSPLPRFGIVLDMVGAKELSIPREAASQESAPALMDAIYDHAKEAGLSGVFPDKPGQRIYDDHVPLIEAGLPSVDLIGFDYAYWHTQQDTPDKCSPDSLRAVGEVVARTIFGKLP